MIQLLILHLQLFIIIGQLFILIVQLFILTVQLFIIKGLPVSFIYIYDSMDFLVFYYNDYISYLGFTFSFLFVRF
jgi:hypothetical protein